MSVNEKNLTSNPVGETKIYRSKFYKEEYFKPNDLFANTAYEIFNHGWKNGRDAPLFGTRTNNGQGPYEWQTYNQIRERVLNLSSGFEYLRTKYDLSDNETQWPVGIYSINRPEWNITDLACSFRSLYTVGLYSTYSEANVRYVCEHSDLKIIVASLDKVANILKDSNNLPQIKVIICMDELPTKDQTKDGHALKLWAFSLNIALFSIKEIEQLGSENKVEPILPKPESIFTLCYTSGTSGKPKGVVLSHWNSASGLPFCEHLLQIRKLNELCYMSYLPLAHCYERNNTNSIYYYSGSIGFYSGDISKFMKDVAELKPTILPAVPRVLNRLYDAIVAKCLEGKGIFASLFKKAYYSKLDQLKRGGGADNYLWDRLVFNQVRKILGGRVKLISSASAPLATNVLDFLRIVLCPVIHEGYGLSETSASGCVTLRNELESGHVGSPFPNVELKLVDIPEMNYLTSDSPFPRGEICIRGPGVFQKYHKDPEATAEVIDKDGWFRTGDVGLIDPRENLKIIDRKKNLFKLSQGEYIAPEKIENVYSQCTKVLQSFVHGDSLRSHLVAIFVPDPEVFLPWARQQLSQSDLTFEEACQNQTIKEYLLTELNTLGTKQELNGFEKIKALHLEPMPFSVENNLLTPTFKLKRPEAKSHYQEIIERLYETKC